MFGDIPIFIGLNASSGRDCRKQNDEGAVGGRDVGQMLVSVNRELRHPPAAGSVMLLSTPF
jgi:hypothetical protein